MGLRFLRTPQVHRAAAQLQPERIESALAEAEWNYLRKSARCAPARASRPLRHQEGLSLGLRLRTRAV